MDKAHVRQLLESALAAREEMVAARAAAEAARDASRAAQERAWDRAKKLAEVLGGRDVLYGGQIVSVNLSHAPDSLSISLLESVEVIDPPPSPAPPLAVVPPPPPSPVMTSPEAKKAAGKPPKPPKAGLDDGAPLG